MLGLGQRLARDANLFVNLAHQAIVLLAVAHRQRLERTVDVRYGELPARRYPLVRTFFAGLAEADRELLLIQGP